MHQARTKETMTSVPMTRPPSREQPTAPTQEVDRLRIAALVPLGDTPPVPLCAGSRLCGVRSGINSAFRKKSEVRTWRWTFSQSLGLGIGRRQSLAELQLSVINWSWQPFQK